MARTAFLTALALLFSTSLLAAGTGPSSLFVILGGYGSCTQAPGPAPGPNRSLVWEKFDSDLTPAVQAETGIAPTYVATCYGVENSGWVDYSIDFRGFVSSMTATNAMNIIPFFGTPSAEEFDQAVDWVVSSVEQLASGNPRIYIIGHSYGAWTGLQAATQLIGKGKTVRAIYTLDPISPLLCGPRAYLNSFPVVPEGCKSAPMDLQHSSRERLLSQLSGRWYNFYETDHALLHSGPIPELDAIGHDTQLEIPATAGILSDQHLQLSADPRAWAKIQEKTLQDLQEKSE